MIRHKCSSNATITTGFNPLKFTNATVKTGFNPFLFTTAVLLLFLFSCGSMLDESQTINPIPKPSCSIVVGGSSDVNKPILEISLKDSWHESWNAGISTADIDSDGIKEIISARSGLLIVWKVSGEILYKFEVEGRIWASPIVADFLSVHLGNEIVFAARDKIYMFNSYGDRVHNFPVTFKDEIRSLAAGDIDGDGELEIVAVTTSKITENNQRDIIFAIKGNGTVLNGFPPNTSGSSGCDDYCFVTGGYDNNLALGDVDNDGVLDIFATQDNAYMSLHKGTGYAFDANPMFEDRTKFPGIRFLHNLEEAKQGYSEDEENANQAHFTNSAPAIADINNDGIMDLVVLGSVQNASQDDRLRGVGLWVVQNDGTRDVNFAEPFHVKEYLSGLWDFEDTNIIGATNSVSVAEINPDYNGYEMIFAGFDGKIHAVSANKTELWKYEYTSSKNILTSGVSVADLSNDGIPEIIFNTYSTDENKSNLFILDAGGNLLHKLPLPQRGAIAMPTIDDINKDGYLDIAINLKDSDPQVQIYSVYNSSDNCLLWPTQRGNYLRNGYIPKE